MLAKTNVGLIDRIIRLLISAPLFYLALYFPMTAEDTVASYTLLAVGAVNTIVALIGVCPVYMAIGVNTAKPQAAS